MKTLLRPLAMALLAAALLGCSSAASDGFAGRTFIASTVTTAGAARDLVPGTSVRVTFGEDGRLGVSAGCNTMGASYGIDGATLRIDDAAMTEMACDDARMAQDEWVFALFGAAPTVVLAGDDLTLAAGDTVMRLADREVADPDLSLTGTIWRVDSIIVGDAVSSVPDGVQATLVFDVAGRVDVATGCNRGGGTYVVDGDTLRFGALALTKMACDGPAGAMESAVLAVLGADRVAFAIEASRLTLTAGAAGVALQGS